MSLATLKITNPATGEPLGEAPIAAETQVREAVQKSRKAQSEWNALGFKKRGELILKARRIILDEIDALAALISKENGKPIIEALSHDIMPVMDLMTYFSKKSEGLLKKEKIRLGKWGFMGHASHLEYEPYGVIGIISPWNFPFSIPVGEVVMALMVGNTVVLKPSEYTPFIAMKIGEIFWKAGIPRDVFQIVTGDGTTGAALVHSGVDKICFTGSVGTGKKIMAEAAKTLTPVQLELGGKDPMIVLSDADIDLASSAAVWGAFCNSGQVCASVERVYVHESLALPFTQLVVEKTKKLRQGVGLSSDVDVASMTAEMQMRKVEEQVEEAKIRGAKILVGGERNRSLKGCFYRPTVLTCVDHSFSVVRDETFGPVLPIMTFKTESEAIEKANDSPYGLNAYIWTKNLKKGRALASKIVAGTVNVNESVFTHALAQTPWGGPKASGMGHTHGAVGLADLVRLRHVHVNRMASKRMNFWWYGYSSEKVEMVKALCWALFGNVSERIRGTFKFLKLFLKVKTM